MDLTQVSRQAELGQHKHPKQQCCHLVNTSDSVQYCKLSLYVHLITKNCAKKMRINKKFWITI